MYKIESIFRLVVISLLYISAITTQSEGQTVTDTFTIEDLNDPIGPNTFSYIYEDDDYYYYFVDEEIITITSDVVNGELVYEYEFNELSYRVDDEVIETSILPSTIDTTYGTYLTLIKFTKDFQLVDYTIFQNASDAPYSKYFVEDFKVKNGKLYFIIWSNTEYPLIINGEEYFYEKKVDRRTVVNNLIVLDKNLKLENIRYFPTFKVKGIIPKSENQVIIGGEIWRYYREGIIGGDTIINNDADYAPTPLYRENVIISLYDYDKDSSIWSELVSNNLGVQLRDVEENYNGKEFYLHLAAGDPYVYVGAEDSPSDSVEVVGGVNDLEDYYRDHLLMKFDEGGNFVSSFGIPEGLFDQWEEVEIDEKGNIFISILYYDDEIQIRDSVYVNEYIKNGSSGFSFRNGILKIDSIGDIDYVYFMGGEYERNYFYRMKLEGTNLYFLTNMTGKNMVVGDSVISGGNDEHTNFVFRVNGNDLEPQIIYNSADKVNSTIEIVELSEDTLIVVGAVGLLEEYFGYIRTGIEEIAILKVAINELVSSDNYIITNNSDKVRIYPNPVMSRSVLNIDFAELENIPHSISIIDLKGSLKESFSILQNNYKTKITVPDLPPGTYMIFLYFRNKQIIKKLVVL